MVDIDKAVDSHNEWDPLEEVVVGSVQTAHIPAWHVTLRATMPQSQQRFLRSNAAKPFPTDIVTAAQRELDLFAAFLEGEGIIVRRPDAVDHSVGFSTPDWSSPTGLYSAMPRDVMLDLEQAKSTTARK